MCFSHGGGAPQVRIKAAQRIAEQKAAAIMVKLGAPVDISPSEALLEQVRWSAGHVAFLRGKVNEVDPDMLTWGVSSEVHKGSGEFPGTDTTSEASPNVWWRLYCDERDRLTRISSAALKAGVEERRVQLAERQGALVADVIRAVLARVFDRAVLAGLPAAAAASWPAWVGEIVSVELRRLGEGGDR